MIVSVNKRQIIAGRTYRGSPEEKQFNIDFWRKVSSGEKLVAAWEMVGEISRFKGHPHVGESRLQRFIECVKRRRR